MTVPDFENKELEQLASMIARGFDAVDTRFDALEARVGSLDERVGALEKDIATLRRECIFRGEAATGSNAIRPLIPIEGGHP